jgi:nucleotide-binding universal stress UspA family protein
MYPLRAAPDQAQESAAPQLAIVIPHTDAALTEAALHEAVRLALSLNARITLLAACILPFPEPLDPTRGYPGLPELMALAEAVGLPVTVQIVYARDWESVCDHALAQGSLIVMAARKAWRRTREERLAECLTRAGHKVTLVPVQGGSKCWM